MNSLIVLKILIVFLSKYHVEFIKYFFKYIFVVKTISSIFKTVFGEQQVLESKMQQTSINFVYCRNNKSIMHLIKMTIITILNIFNVICNRTKKTELIYVLEWTSVMAPPFTHLEKGLRAFEVRQCAFQNCFLTSDHSYFSDVLDYDVFLFNAAHMNNDLILPSSRSPSQVYIMVDEEPAGYYSLSTRFDDFINFTWTYKLDSDILFPYIKVENQFGEVIGPKIDMHWMKIEEMNETSDFVKNKLRNKKIAAAVFVSNCFSQQRLNFIDDLKKNLAKYGHRVDVYGTCGDHRCPKGESKDECYAKIESDYYFYLSFENSFGVDYVSEKLLNALEHYAVPVVLGGANYSR